MSIIRNQLGAIYAEHGKNLSKLLAELGAHAKSRPGALCNFDRRKLRALVEESDLISDPKLSVSELHCLNSFLESRGLGFMKRPPVIEELVTKPRVHFVLPAKAIEKATYVSFWDNQAFVRAVNLLNQFGRVVQFKLHYQPKDEIFDWPEPVVYLASPKVSAASEHAMRRLFDLPEEPATDEPFNLPFFFARPRIVPSRFCVSSKKVPAFIDKHGWSVGPFDNFDGQSDWGFGLKEKKKIYIERQQLEDHGNPSNEFAHGVLVVGKNMAGELRIICAGSTGPATYGLAEALSSSPLARRGVDPAFVDGEARRSAWAAFRFPIFRHVDKIEQIAKFNRLPGEPELLHSEGFSWKAL